VIYPLVGVTILTTPKELREAADELEKSIARGEKTGMFVIQHKSKVIQFMVDFNFLKAENDNNRTTGTSESETPPGSGNRFHYGSGDTTK
jgi:hypothetical protein